MRLALVLPLILASSTSLAKPHEPRLRERAIAGLMPARARTAFEPLAKAGWRASWDRDTGVPAWLWGAYFDVPGSVADGAIAERAARQFIALHGGVLAPGAAATDFIVVANRLHDGVRSVGFAQTWRGVPVIGGRLGFVFVRDRLFAISSSAWPDVSAQPMTKMTAVLPIVRNDAITYHAVDSIEVGSGADRWRVYRDAHGRELARERRVMDATGTLEYNVPVRHPGGEREDMQAPTANIQVNSVATTTTSTGTFTWSGTSASSVVPSITGTYVRVINQAGPEATTTLTVQPSMSGIWDLSSDEEGDAQLATYVHANRAKTRARVVNPAVATWLDAQLDFFVNENGSCNAFSTGNDVHLYRGNAQCENSGRLADVVYHEFGHSLHNNSVIAGMGAFESHLSEGLADFFAASITEDPAVGRGFFLDDSPLRDIDPVGNERVYPVDLDFDPHVSGLIIAGALWDLRKALIKQLGPAAGVARTDKVFTGIMQHADDIGTTFVAALIADDDDGNLANNTPNYCAIERAFGSHGLVPDYKATRVNPPLVDGLEMAMMVDTPTATMCAPAAVVAIRVTWRVGDGVPSSFDLAPDGATWRGSFPEQPDSTVLLYAVDVLFDDGSVQVFPNNPADPRYQLFVGSAVPIYCEAFNTNPSWPQQSNAGLEWEWGKPVIGTNGNDPPAAFTGENVLGTDLSTDGFYRPEIHVSTSTPMIDVSKYEIVHLQYRRWLTVEDATFDQAQIRVNNNTAWTNAKAVTGTLDHVDREWRFHEVDLTPYVVDGHVEVSWALVSDFGKELGGWTLDDVCIVGLVKIPRCGDGELDSGEECDDGNNTNDDGCDRECIDEVTAGGGGCCDAGTPSNGWLCLLVLALFRRRR